MDEEQRMRWVPFMSDPSQRVPIRLEKEFATRPEAIGLDTWVQDCTKRLASDTLTLVRVAKLASAPSEVEQCLPDFWRLSNYEKVYRQVLVREQDEKWQYALIGTSVTTAGDYRSELRERGPDRQDRWCSLSQCLSYVSTILGGSVNPWPEVRDAISGGLLRARGSCFGIAHQPLQSEWMSVAMWDDANDDAIFFRVEKGSDLVPPQRVPGYITNLEVCATDIERCWRIDTKELTMSSLAEMEPLAGTEGKPTLRSIDVKRQGMRGPKPGSLDRYGEADRTLFPEVAEKMRAENLSANAAALRLAESGKVAGTGTHLSLAKRLAGRYLRHR